jgi:2-oxoglutarate/2-oxoacid ferredoxin oxidoreductase subunit beta
MTPPTVAAEAVPNLSPKDFQSDQVVRWCPGCGDYAILNAVQHAMTKIGVAREDIVFVSGIGCAARFPYYMNTYGFHTIHGRAPGFASGLKVANPALSVWIVSGDGDALSIGGNHLLHVLRRNMDVKLLLFNNRIYGLTKGQYSPTSEAGKVTKSSPQGAIDRPLAPCAVAIAAEATFIARSVDVQGPHLQRVLAAAAAHRGSAFVEILQNCPVFNDGAFDNVTARGVRAEQQLELVHGQPMRFGAEGNKGIRLNGTDPEIVTIGEHGVTEADLWVHDENDADGTNAYILSRMGYPHFPTPLGVLRRLELPTYEAQLHRQVEGARAKSAPNLARLVAGPQTWQVDDQGQISEG